MKRFHASGICDCCDGPTDDGPDDVTALADALRRIKQRGDQGGRLCDTSYGMWRIACDTLRHLDNRD